MFVNKPKPLPTNTHPPTTVHTRTTALPPPRPLQLLHSVDYFQHNKIWGCSGSKSWSPLVYFCDGILIHSQRLHIAVAWHRLLHLALDTELEAAPTCSKSSRPTGREQLEGVSEWAVLCWAACFPSAHHFPCTIICSWCYRGWFSPAGPGIWSCSIWLRWGWAVGERWDGRLGNEVGFFKGVAAAIKSI